MKIPNIFKPLDELLFSLADQFRSSSMSQKVTDSISTLSEKSQQLINQAMALSVILLPLLICLIILAGNCSVRKQINTKEEIIEQVEKFNGRKNNFTQIGKQILSPFPIKVEQDLQKRVGNALASSGINLDSVEVKNFSQKSMESMAESTADLHFKNFSVVDLSNFLTTLLEREKVKISRFIVQRDKSTESLKGQISLKHFSRTGR